MKPHPESITLEASTDRIHADLQLIVTPYPNRERGGAARFDLETRDGTPLASFTVGCQGAALIMQELGRVFPADWPLELRDAPIPYGIPH
jgi:hypothetical protein